MRETQGLRPPENLFDMAVAPYLEWSVDWSLWQISVVAAPSELKVHFYFVARMFPECLNGYEVALLC